MYTSRSYIKNISEFFITIHHSFEIIPQNNLNEPTSHPHPKRLNILIYIQNVLPVSFSVDIFVLLYSILKFSMRFPLNLALSALSHVFLCLLLYCLRCFQLARLFCPCCPCCPPAVALLVSAASAAPSLVVADVVPAIAAATARAHRGLPSRTEVLGRGRPWGVTHQQ